MSFEFFIARRYLLAKRQQTFISVISLISVLGVALGVASLIIVLGVMTGFSQNLRDKILGVNAHIVIGSLNGVFDNYQQLTEKSLQVPGVLGATPFIYSEVMISGGGGVKGVVLRGIEPETASTVINLQQDMIHGSIAALSQPKSVIVGYELAKRLNLQLGSQVSLLAPSGKASAAGFSPKIVFFKVVGIFKSGMFEYDSSLAYISIASAQELMGFKGNVVTGLEFKVDDVYGVHEIGRELHEAVGGFPFYVRDWIEMNQNLFSALKMEKSAMAVILVMIVLVGSFSIVTTLVMLVMEKTRDIAVLMSLGATRNCIRKIFILQGMIIGLVGTCLGYALGLGIGFLLKRYQFIKLPLDVYYLDHIPMQFNALDLALIGGAAMLLCFLATLYPARQASRLNPTEALRYE